MEDCLPTSQAWQEEALGGGGTELKKREAAEEAVSGVEVVVCTAWTKPQTLLT
jgi:hypothetical protein